MDLIEEDTVTELPPLSPDTLRARQTESFPSPNLMALFRSQDDIGASPASTASPEYWNFLIPFDFANFTFFFQYLLFN